MKQLYLKALVVLMVIAMCGGCITHSYTKKDKQLLGVLWAASIADYYQTKQIKESSDFEEWNNEVEDNTEALMLGIPLAVTIGGFWVEPKKREIFFKTFIGVKAGVVAYNYERGVR